MAISTGFGLGRQTSLPNITHSENRGSITINSHFPKGFGNSTSVHDGWKPQINTPEKHHQTCLSHLLRRLTYLNQRDPNATWGRQFLQLLSDALHLNKILNPSDVERMKIIIRFKNLLEQPPD